MVHPGSSRTTASVAKPYFDEPGCTIHVYTYYTVPVLVTDYGLDGPGSNPGGDEIFRPTRPTLGPTQLPVK